MYIYKYVYIHKYIYTQICIYIINMYIHMEVCVLVHTSNPGIRGQRQEDCEFKFRYRQKPCL